MGGKAGGWTKTPSFQSRHGLSLPICTPDAETPPSQPPTPSPSTLACHHVDCLKNQLHLLRCQALCTGLWEAALINLFYFISHPLTACLWSGEGVCRCMQITCKSPTGAKCLGPCDSVAGLREQAQLTWKSPWDQGNLACPVCAGAGGGGGWGETPRKCPHAASSLSAGCHSGLPPPTASFPKEPAEWRDKSLPRWGLQEPRLLVEAGHGFQRMWARQQWGPHSPLVRTPSPPDKPPHPDSPTSISLQLPPHKQGAVQYCLFSVRLFASPASFAHPL